MSLVRMQPFIYPDGRMNTDNAAKYLGYSVKTLAMMRSNGTGPRFTKLGRVFYYQEDLDAWVAEKGRVKSTAQARVKKSVEQGIA
jgi:predicted DNA-binding transcriptional regulator AlpA